MAACGSGDPYVQTAVKQSPKAMHFRRRTDFIPHSVPHSTDMQDGRPMVTLIKKKPKQNSFMLLRLNSVEDMPGLFFTDNASSQALLLSSHLILCGTII